MYYIGVDENNQWLIAGDFDSPEEAYKSCQEATEYDPTAEIIVYRIDQKHIYEPVIKE